MSTYDGRSKRNLAERRCRVGVLCVVALLLSAACRTAATPVESTATSVPPTATPEPSTVTPIPTATPRLATLPEDGRVRYDPAGAPGQWLTVRQPEVGESPYPWVFVATSASQMASSYGEVVDELLARGYATVVFATGDKLSGAAFCAWAWLEDNNAVLGLDTRKAIVFAHGTSLAGPLLGVADDSVWAEMLSSCPNPAPPPASVRGVATYSASLLVPQGTMSYRPSPYYYMFWYALDRDIGEEYIPNLATLLRTLPPSEWRTSGQLDNTKRFVAHWSPLYYIYGPKPVGEMPAFLLTHGGQMDKERGEPLPEESQLMAEALIQAGLSVETVSLPDARFDDILTAGSGVPEQLAEAIDTWAKGLFAGD
ncbi:MAG: hypothetical protein JXC32_17710 [Anaerolineae bacterium]|nr:hypothetical protein [Anaerolineae bacterium]